MSAVAVRKRAVARGARLLEMSAARTRTTTNSLATAHVVGMRARRREANAARWGILLNGTQSARIPSAGVRPRAQASALTPPRSVAFSSASIQMELGMSVVVVRRLAVARGARPLEMSAARMRTTTNSLAMAHAVGMRAQRREANAARSGILPNGIRSARRRSAGVRPRAPASPRQLALIPKVPSAV